MQIEIYCARATEVKFFASWFYTLFVGFSLLHQSQHLTWSEQLREQDLFHHINVNVTIDTMLNIDVYIDVKCEQGFNLVENISCFRTRNKEI